MTFFRKALRQQGHSVSTTLKPADARSMLLDESYGAVVMLGTSEQNHASLLADTQSLCKTLKTRYRHIRDRPIFVLLCANAPAEMRAEVLMSGVDACFCEPWYFSEIYERILRLNFVLNEYRKHASSVGCDGADMTEDASFTQSVPRLDERRRELVLGNKRFRLTSREYLFFDCLLEVAPKPVSRDALLRHCWGEKDEAFPYVVGQMVLRIRARLKEMALPVEIKAVPRFGYCVTFPGL